MSVGELSGPELSYITLELIFQGFFLILIIYLSINMMVYKVKYKTYNTFLKHLEKREWDLVKTVVESILAGIVAKKKKIPVFLVECEDEKIGIDFVVEESQYKQMLKVGLDEYIKRELYEDCAIIKKAIDSYEPIKKIPAQISKE